MLVDTLLRRETQWLGQTRIKLLGVLYAGPQFTVEGKIQVVPVPTKTTPVSVSQIPTNLGLVIKAELILEFEEIFEKKLQQESNN